MKGEVDIMVNFPIETFLKNIAHSALVTGIGKDICPYTSQVILALSINTIRPQTPPDTIRHGPNTITHVLCMV